MYKLLGTKIIYSFLFLMLFIGIISNKLGIFAYFLIVFFLAIFSFFKFKYNQVNLNLLYFLLFGLILLYGSFIYQLLYYGYNNLYYIQFFGSQLLFFLVFGFFGNINLFVEKYMSKFLLVSLLLLSFIIYIDYILINSGLASYQLMYKDDIPHSYLGKPLGIFAQFSVNSTYCVVFYMLYLYFNTKKSNKINIILFFLVTFVIILQNSGTGYIAYLLLIMTMLYRYTLTKFILIPLMLAFIIVIILSNSVQKISIDYLLFLFDYFYNTIIISYLENIHSIKDILFGIDGNYVITIDFGPLFMIAKVGLLYFIYYSILLFYMFYKASSRYFKMSIFILAFGNLHYPTLFYPLMNVLIPILFLYLFQINTKFLNYNNIGMK